MPVQVLIVFLFLRFGKIQKILYLGIKVLEQELKTQNQTIGNKPEQILVLVLVPVHHAVPAVLFSICFPIFFSCTRVVIDVINKISMCY